MVRLSPTLTEAGNPSKNIIGSIQLIPEIVKL